MKKVLWAACLCVSLGLLLALSDCRQACAADAARGSLGVLENVTEEQLEKARKLTAQNDVDEQFEREFKKKKWNAEFDKNDLKYMSCIIYCEARNMNFDARAAVGNVVLNRMRSVSTWSHVSTIKDVIYDKGPNGRWGTQFSPTKDGSLKKALAVYENLDKGTNRSWDESDMKGAIEVAKAVLKGYRSVPEDFMYFNAYVKTQPAKCEKNGRDYIILERHVYYK